VGETEYLLLASTVLSSQTLLGKILRLPLSLIPPESTVRILRGPLRGLKWIVGASNHACWAGTYEVDNLSVFAAAITPGASVYDVGANVGIYTLLASLKAGVDGRVYAFEPLARNLRYLHRHVAVNERKNCLIMEVAVSDTEGMQRFSAATWEQSMARLSRDGELEIPTVTLDRCIYGENGLRPPNVIKIDVEGAELLVLRGATRTLTEYHPWLFIEIHGTEQHRECREFLAAKGYRLREDYGRIIAIWEPRVRPGEELGA
jgi:FkbM family methyltransferase